MYLAGRMSWRYRDELILAGKAIGATLVALLPCLAYPFNKYVSLTFAYLWVNTTYAIGYERVARVLGIDERAAKVAWAAVCLIAFLILVGSFIHLGMSRG